MCFYVDKYTHVVSRSLHIPCTNYFLICKDILWNFLQKWVRGGVLHFSQHSRSSWVERSSRYMCRAQLPINPQSFKRQTPRSRFQSTVRGISTLGECGLLMFSKLSICQGHCYQLLYLAMRRGVLILITPETTAHNEMNIKIIYYLAIIAGYLFCY